MRQERATTHGSQTIFTEWIFKPRLSEGLVLESFVLESVFRILNEAKQKKKVEKGLQREIDQSLKQIFVLDALERIVRKGKEASYKVSSKPFSLPTAVDVDVVVIKAQVSVKKLSPSANSTDKHETKCEPRSAL